MKAKKKNIITLEVEDDELLDNVAYLLFRSPQPGYLFVDSLNKLYGYALHRIDDMELDGVAWPFYTHSDKIDHLKYYLTEKPRTATSAALGDGDKLMIIKGEGARDMAEYICEDFTDPMPVDSGDLLAEEHARLRDEMLADFTVVSLLDMGDIIPAPQSKRGITMEQQCAIIEAYIEIQRLDITEQ